MQSRMRYLTERVVTRSGRLMALLAVACVIIIGLVTVLVLTFMAGDLPNGGLREWEAAVWESVRNVIDPGSVGENSEHSRSYRLIMLLTTIGGILVIGALVAVLSSALYRQIEAVRQGRTPVVESGHTVVLGWSNQLYTILDEIARAPVRRPRVVVLGNDLSKEDMDDAVRRRPQRRASARDGAVRRVKVVCRYGDPTRIEDLALVSLDTAADIVVPQPVGPKPDVRVLMTLLALNHRPWPGSKRPVAAVISSAAKYQAAVLALATWPQYHVVNAEELTARLIVQSRRYPGLTVACSELMSFEGVEVHTSQSLTAAMTYKEALLLFDTASLVGFRRDGRQYINPKPDTLMVPTDTLLLIARQARDIRARRSPRVVRQRGLLGHDSDSNHASDARTLILGWNSRIGKVVQVLDEYVDPGAQVTIVGQGFDLALLPKTRNIAMIRGRDDDPIQPGVLLAADASETVELREALHDLEADEVAIPIDPRQFDSVIVLASDANESHTDADALTLLLLLQAIKRSRNGDFSVICELEEDANRRLAQGITADDLVVGQRVVSTLAVHFAKNPERLDMIKIVEEWLDARDSNLYFDPASHYVALGQELDWATVVAAAAETGDGQTAIGYVASGDRGDEEQNYGVCLNPGKAEPRMYHQGDFVIVVRGRGEDPDESDRADSRLAGASAG